MLPASLAEHVALQVQAWTVAFSRSTSRQPAGRHVAASNSSSLAALSSSKVHKPVVHAAKHLRSLSRAFLLVLHMKLHGLLKRHVTKCWRKGICCHHHGTVHVTHCKPKNSLRSEKLRMTAAMQATVSAACVAGPFCWRLVTEMHAMHRDNSRRQGVKQRKGTLSWASN